MLWSRGCILIPLILFIFSIYVAYRLCWVIEFSSGDQCDWLPQTRRGIICLSLFCLLFFFMFQAKRGETLQNHGLTKHSACIS